jgi:hypothetical protein
MHSPDAPIADSIDAAIREIYAVISGPQGAPREWARYETLFSPAARLVIVHALNDKLVAVEALTPEEYRASRDCLLVARGFVEAETGRETCVHGRVAHVFSRFEGRQSTDGALVATGWNSIQLIWSEGRWKVMSILWEATPLAAQLRQDSGLDTHATVTAVRPDEEGRKAGIF